MKFPLIQYLKTAAVMILMTIGVLISNDALGYKVFANSSAAHLEPFLISSSTSVDHPYKGNAFPIGDKMIIVEERFASETTPPYNAHLFVSWVKGIQRIVEPKQLFPDSKKYFYNPQFLKFKSDLFLFFNAFDPTTDTASFERSLFDGNSFSAPEQLIIDQDLKEQYRPWMFASSSNDERVALSYEWSDRVIMETRLKFAISNDALHFGLSVEKPIGVMARNEFFKDGAQIFTYQNGIQSNMIDFFSLSSDGVKWSEFSRVSDQKNVHDTVPFPRLDGKMDLYYVSSGTRDCLSLFRRSVDQNGFLGPEQGLADKVNSAVMQPHPVRLPDGSIFLVLTKRVEGFTNYDLLGMYIQEDASVSSGRN